MVFENLTLFELHLEGDARIGPSFGDDAEAADAGDSDGGRRLGLVLAGLLLIAGAAAVARRRRDERADAEQITIEQAAEQ